MTSLLQNDKMMQTRVDGSYMHSTIVYRSNESSKNFFTGNSIQTSAFYPSFIRFPSTFLVSLPIQGRAIDNSFQKVNECVTLEGGVTWVPVFERHFAYFLSCGPSPRFRPMSFLFRHSWSRSFYSSGRVIS